jgi:hypothetical protein
MKHTESRPRPFVRPRLEWLEDRVQPSGGLSLTPVLPVGQAVQAELSAPTLVINYGLGAGGCPPPA